MTSFILIGLVLALAIVAVYLIVAAYRKKRPELSDAIIILLGAGGIASSVRIVGFILTGEFQKITGAHPGGTSMWSLEREDAALIFIGGVALAWVSVQTIFESFAKLSSQDSSSQRTGHDPGAAGTARAGHDLGSAGTARAGADGQKS